jgi:hypothetical protein
MNCQIATKEYTSVCSICGFPLRKEDIFASMCGELWHQGMPEHMSTPAQLHFCLECFLKVKTYANESVERAMRKTRQLENNL